MAGLEAAHPLKDLKLNDLDMMDAYQGYQRRLDQLNAGFHCTRCPDLSAHVRFAGSALQGPVRAS